MAFVDQNLISVQHIRERMQKYKDKLSRTEFFHLLKYLQYGIPYGEIATLRSQGIEERLWREFDPADGYKPATKSLDLFNSFIASSDKVCAAGNSFFFYGNNASGKSYLALYIMASFVEKGHTAWYTHFKDYMHLFNEVHYKETSERKLLDHVYQCDLLVIDEVGKESNVTDNVIGEYERLLKSRDNEGLPTIIVTNLNLDDFASRYGSSVSSVLEHKYRFIHFNKDNKFRAARRLEWEI